MKKKLLLIVVLLLSTQCYSGLGDDKEVFKDPVPEKYQVAPTKENIDAFKTFLTELGLDLTRVDINPIYALHNQRLEAKSKKK